ncbi:DUF3427 domain-containing protein [Corynebacterium pacaense]|uniref:DUF3427 domain-containing protein n=1 Tax=Corynebacterium pacaense TaxID=1816684 RepID=UPI0009BBF3EC|nr:DEAD/DEAH box helicase [Corynebacterium pacaense]
MRQADSSIRRDIEFGFLDNTVASDQILNPLLISNSEDHKMLRAIREELAKAESFVFSVAFISSRGIALIKEALVEFEGTGEIITSNYLDFNDPRAFRELLLLDNVTTYVHDDGDRGFHAKGYIFHRVEGVTAIVGSSNLTDNALLVNQEWNLRFSAFPEGDIAFQLDDAVRRQKSRSHLLTEGWIADYEANRKSHPRLVAGGDQLDVKGTSRTITPNSMQAEALEALQDLQDLGESKAVVISATGTGKTILAALAVRAAQPQRLLFVVHREQILNKAISEFQRVLEEPSDSFGKLVGPLRELDRNYVFSTVQSLSRDETLHSISRERFDYIIIDEVHRAGAESYKKIIDYFAPSFLLGLTATPERTDGFNIFELFDYNVPYEIRLQRALEEKMLVPFHYYGVTDFVNAENEVIDDVSELAKLVSHERAKYVLEMLRRYGHPTGVKGLMFCSRKDEAHELSTIFNEQYLNGRRLRTKVLTGEDSAALREAVIQELEEGAIDYILTVDIFNEGIDIPPVNQVVMLRSTQSSIIFTQQLGRGLRKAPGKDHLRVIDFIGNYKNSYLIPVALFGDNSRNKESIRKNLLDHNSTRTIAEVSSVNFDPIAQELVLQSLKEAKLVGKQIFKKDIQALINRLGRLPQLFDFARFDTVDPVLISTQYSRGSQPRSYWHLLHGLKFVDHAPRPAELEVLGFLSTELLPGKRPHELLLLQALIQRGTIARAEFAQLLSSKNTNADELTIRSVERILSLEFYMDAQRKKFGGRPIAISDGEVIKLSPQFHDLYFAEPQPDRTQAEVFSNHVDDIIETGLFLSRERGFWSGEMKSGAMYSRREVCRLLNWPSNHESTMYGYKLDRSTATLPIFVTYHKDESVSESTKYEDELITPKTMRWFSKSGRRFDSKELQPIINNEAALHLLVKKDDSEGREFYYLGKALSENQREETMKNVAGKGLSVVTMDLDLESPVEQSLFEYLTQTKHS